MSPAGNDVGNGNGMPGGGGSACNKYKDLQSGKLYVFFHTFFFFFGQKRKLTAHATLRPSAFSVRTQREINAEFKLLPFVVLKMY